MRPPQNKTSNEVLKPHFGANKDNGGESGIRTHGPLTVCRFQGDRVRPTPPSLPEKLAGARGLEPRKPVLETSSLPLAYAP